MPKRISDESVKNATGKSWKAWFAILDKAGAKTMEHPAIAELLSRRYKVPSWWCQMVTVTYEQARKGRQLHQRPQGYEFSVSRTIAKPIAALYRAWIDPRKRAMWLRKNVVIHRAVPNKRLRITWTDGQRSIEVLLTPMSTKKTQVVVQHGKLSNAKQVATLKAFWKTRLRSLG